MFPRGQLTRIGRAYVLLTSTRPTATDVTLRVRGAEKTADFSSGTDLASATATVPPNGKAWVCFNLNCDVADAYAWLALPRVEGVSWSLMASAPTGSCRAYKMADKPWHAVRGQYYAFHLDKPIVSSIGGYAPSNVINGVSRIVGDQTNMWMSDPAEPMAQWIQLDLGERKHVNSVYLTFDTDMNSVPYRGMNTPEDARFQPTCIRDYRLSALVGNQWLTLATVGDNYQRRRIHRFDRLQASKIKLDVERTNGAPSARVFEIRVYDE
jgi:hypothetical protein